MRSNIASLTVLCVWLSTAAPGVAQEIPHPTDFFGFDIGADGELARYPRILDYLQLLARESDRVDYERRGTTTLGNPYVLATISSPANLSRLDRLVEINHRLNDPRGLSEAEALALAREGVPFYFLYATIHSTEVGNTQTLIKIAHRLATDASPEIAEMLDNVVLLMVPSQNPDGQLLVIDHWYDTRDTDFTRTYPDLYHHYAGHDDNRDWFMFTQIETRLALDIHRELKPQITHDMHQMGSTGARIFVPPYQDPHDPNIHPLLLEGQAQIGMAMAGALVSEGKGGVVYADEYDLWAPARQYMVYHGQARILTEIASASIADPFVNPAGFEVPLGPQDARVNFPVPFDKGVWRLGDIVDYGYTAVFAALEQVSKNRTSWMENYYKVHRDWVTRDEAPYAFVISADQRDPFETYELLELLHTAEVEIDQARNDFTAGNRRYPAGSWVVQLAQPAGAFAKTMLETQVYPDLRYYPGGPPIAPYDVTAQTLGLLMGVDVDQIDQPVEEDLARAGLVQLAAIAPQRTPMPATPRWGYAIGPESNASFLAVARLQQAGVTLSRASDRFRSNGREYAPGTWVVPPSEDATRILGAVAEETGLVVTGIDVPPNVTGFRWDSRTRIGLWRAANNVPGGWMRWLFEQYELGHAEVSSLDFDGDLSDKYDVIVLPSGTTRSQIVSGLDSRRHAESWRWAYGVGDAGWRKLAAWVENGGTLVAVGSAVSVARELLDLPIEPVLPLSGGRPPAPPPRGARDGTDLLRDAFQSLAQLLRAPRDPVVEPSAMFYGPGSLLKQEFNPRHPVAFGMPERWPVFFSFDQAYRLTPSFDIVAETVSRYPDEEDLVASGWLLGDALLRNQANVVAFSVGRGSVVTLGSQIAFRAQTRGTFKLLFNAIFQGAAQPVGPAEFAVLN
ncbi:MAG: M14 family zinc carboxypeptidase [Acidobacteria bacterium]|nr:M14 family zinc carboxypeptidase [Acidobacteriota bacterium]